MAIITEEEPETKPSPKSAPPKPTPSPASPPHPQATANPFHFWFYFTLLVSLLTFLTITLSSLTSSQDPKAWFLSLPTNLRHHYSSGRTINVQTSPNLPQVQLFLTQKHKLSNPPNHHHILFVHGLGSSSFSFNKITSLLSLKDVPSVAIDLPGSGFSDKYMTITENVETLGYGVFGRLKEMWYEIQDKGIFWGFDQLVEKGYVDYEAGKSEDKVFRREIVKAVELGSEEMGRVLGQVVDTLRLAPVDLVLHDSALVLSANWILENPSLVRSVVVLDSSPSGTALPIWVLEVPLIREIVLGIGFVFQKVLGLCCSRSVGGSEAEAHRVLLKGRDWGRAVVGTGKKLNTSFNLAEWGSSDGVKDLPMQVIWSSGWSKEWTEEGHRIANVLPRTSFVSHSGGRWPEEHYAEDVAESIYQFVSSLPKTTKLAAEEPKLEHTQKVFDEAQSSGHHRSYGSHNHINHHDDLGHDHDHAHAGYMDAYGLGGGWAAV